MDQNDMKLHSISYTEYKDETYAWTFSDLTLIDINLIVGKNATGKSRVLRVINGLARLIEGTRSPTTIASGRYKAVFKNNDETKPDIVYSLDIHEAKVLSESLLIGDVTKLRRGTDGRGSLYFAKNDDDIDVQIPDTQLAITTRRDPQQHGYFENLHEWAKSVRYFEFSKVQTGIASQFEGKITANDIGTGPLQENLHLILKVALDSYRRDFIGPVISDMKKVGYNITDFGMTPLAGVQLPFKTSNTLTLYIKEVGVDKKLTQNEISDGMLRAFATLVYFHFIRLQKNYGMMLIDDIGEGLDFDRSTRLIAVIIEQAEKGYMQLAMTTNDRFVMNKVPLDYWSIMHRDHGKVEVFNNRNSTQTFEEFQQYGFNNFDFFAKEFFTNGVEVEK